MRFIQLAPCAKRQQDITVFLLGDEVVLGFDVGLKGVEVLAFILFDIGSYSLEDVIW